MERNNNIEIAKRSHIAIYNNFGDISASIKYEAAKHLLMLQSKGKGKQLPNEK
jgi:phage anti-repressor protein